MEEDHVQEKPREIVEIYRAPYPMEIVEVYRSPYFRKKRHMPTIEAEATLEHMPLPPPVLTKKKSGTKKHKFQNGVLFFFLGMLVVAVPTLAIRLWGHSTLLLHDPFLWNFEDEYAETRDDKNISIPTWPYGQGMSFAVMREHGETLTAQAVYREVNPSVVTVLVDLDGDTMAIGTGVIFSADGYFITNYHVIEGGVDCVALLESGYSFPALYVAGDMENDLAILKMDCPRSLPVAQFGDSDLLSVGDTVYAIGNPLGVEFRGTLTNGIVSAIDRDVKVDDRVMTLIQTNAALNSGNSGGPLINEYGQVVGINVIKMSSTRSTVEGLGFAIPSSSMYRLINDLLRFGATQPEPLFGVSVIQIGTEVEKGIWGIEVQSVTPESAADIAGIQTGDYIISAGGESITNSRDLLRVRRNYHMGDQIPMTIWRAGEKIEIILVFGEVEETVKS